MSWPQQLSPRRLRAAWRRRYAGTTARERRLLAGLALVGAALLLTFGAQALATALRDSRALATEWQRRELLLASAGTVETALARTTAGPAARRTGPELLAALDAMARGCGLSADAGNPVVERHGRTELHKVRLLLRGASMEKLVAFDERLRAESTGLCLDRVLLESREAEGGLAATYEITLCRISE